MFTCKKIKQKEEKQNNFTFVECSCTQLSPGDSHLATLGKGGDEGIEVGR